MQQARLSLRSDIYTARHAPLIRSACSIDLALCVRAGALVSQFAEGRGDASGNRVCGPQAAPRPPRGHPQPTSTPWEAGGGQSRPAECGEPMLWPRSGRGGGVWGVALHGPRRHLRGSVRGAQGAFRGGISASTGAPLRSYHSLLVDAPIWSMPPTGVNGVLNSTSALPATCLLLIATALGQVWRCRNFAHL
jgi:hypothetical protein